MMRVGKWEAFQLERGIGVLDDMFNGNLLATAVIAQDAQTRGVDVQRLGFVRMVCRSFLQARDSS